jgi:hypothetical protein
MALLGFVLDVASPAIVLAGTLLLLPLQPPSLVVPSPSSITPVVVSARVPRRGLLLTLLRLTSLTFVLDGLVFSISAILSRRWYLSHVALTSVLGIIAYSGLAIVGAWKDSRGVQVWLRSRVKLSVAASLLVEVAKLALLIKLMTKRAAIFSLPFCFPLLTHEKCSTAPTPIYRSPNRESPLSFCYSCVPSPRPPRPPPRSAIPARDVHPFTNSR